ncbi:glycoside hydrolase family 28 protein [candidate division KSB1 bacterium]|nr:glycoside hydrolase family 28 protein [candidate division KSB1 bacterium]
MAVIIFSCGMTTNDPWKKADEIVENIKLPSFRNYDYNIIAYGAVSDSAIDSRQSIMDAVSQCNHDGGGRVIVPAGIWRCNGPIHLKSNVNLVISAGARLEFGTNPADYLPEVITRFEGTELFGYSPFIYAYQATNIAITGSGIIDGNGRQSFVPWKHRQDADKEILRQMGNDGVPVYKRVMGEGHYIRPGMIQPYGCKNVLIEGITLVDSPFWVIHPTFCNNVIVRGVTVDSWNYNNDGVDPDACVNVLIENCTFNCGDDAVAIKSGRDQDGWRMGQATENVVIRNCQMNSRTNGLCIGSEMSGSVRNVFMENCQVGEAASTIYFKANLDRGGMIENIFVRNIAVERAKTACIRFESNYKGHRGNHYPPRFRNFVIEDVTCLKADQYGFYAVGIEGTPIHDVTLKNVKILQAGIPALTSHISHIQLSNFMINDTVITSLSDSRNVKDISNTLTW